MKKRGLAIVLVLAMAAQSIGLPAYATQAVPESADSVASADSSEIAASDDVQEPLESSQEAPFNQGAVFNFSAAKYVLAENEASYDIKVIREGAADIASDVVFKAVDVFAVYGEDYTILDENGNALPKTDGVVIAPEDLIKPSTPTPEQPTDTTPQKTDIFEARNALMGIDAKKQDEKTVIKDEITEAVEVVNKDLVDAAGVSGVLHFDVGETEKTITVVPIDNQEGASDKTVLMALVAASEGSLAPNATTTLTIMDDEAYEPPVFEMSQEALTLDDSHPQGTLTVKRVSGKEYYSTVFVSTYSMSAVQGEDFTAIDNKQLVFAPGETEKMVDVKALAFDQSGEFGVRIKGDGSCEIGEKDRAVVRITGKKSAQPEKSAPMQQTALQATAEPASAKSPQRDTTLESQGILGVPESVYPKGALIGRTGTSYIGDHVKVGEPFQIQSYYYPKYVTLDCGDFGATPDSVTVDFTLEWDAAGYWGSSEVVVYNGDYLSGKSNTTGGLWGVQHIPLHVMSGQATESVTVDKSNYKEHDKEKITLVLPNNFSGRVTINGVKVKYDRPLDVSVPTIDKIKTQPIIDLNEGVAADQLVNYEPPKPVVQTESGTPVSKVYPSFGQVVNVHTDGEELMKHGVVLENAYKGKYIYHDFYDGQRIGLSTFVDMLDENGQLPVKPTANTVRVHLQDADNGETTIHTKDVTYKKPFEAQTGTILRGSGYAASGKVITGYDIYAATVKSNGDINKTKYLYTYVNRKDSSLLGGTAEEEWFHVPAIQEDGWTEVLIKPKTEVQSLAVKPHPSTKGETIYEDVYDDAGNVVGQRPITYEGRAYLNRTFDANATEEDTLVADKNGEVQFNDLESGAVLTLRSLVPKGYHTEWVNGTLDKDGDGVIDNDQAGDLSQQTADNLYVPVYGNQFVYRVNQSNPQYYYRFTKFDPSRLLDGQTRVGYVKKDKRTILDYNGKEAQYKDYVPCANATVQIGENTARTDRSGRFEIKMDGVPDAVRVSAAVTTESGDFITHVQSNVENDIFIPFYDTFEPQQVTAAYTDEEATTAPGIAVQDKNLTVKVKIQHKANGMYIKDAGFYITDSSGKKVIDCNERAKEADSNYKVDYTNDGTFGYATLQMNPKEDMLSGYKIYMYAIDQNGTIHRAMDTGHRFIETLNLGNFVLGTIGSSFVTDATTEVVELLGAPLFDLDMGQISGFTTTNALIEPDGQLYDATNNKVYEYDATLYSYRYQMNNFGNWSGTNGKEGEAPREGEDSDGGDVDANDYKAQHGEILNKIKEVSSFDPDEVEAEEKPKAASLDNSEKAVSVKSEYNFGLTPSIRMDFITTARPAGKDASGNDIYKHYFEEMSLGVGLDFDVATRTEISFPIGVSIMVKPSLIGGVEAVYYLKTDYGDDKYWERPIEYSPESFGIFKDFDGKMYRSGRIGLNPRITLDVGVKVAIVEVDVGATFDFDMDFKFDSESTRTYGGMYYDMHINLIILKLSVYSKKLTDGTMHLFGEDNPLEEGAVMTAGISKAINEVMEGGDTTVKPVDRSYLDDRSDWHGEGAEHASFLAKLFNSKDADNPADAVLQTGVMLGDGMASAMLDTDTMFTVYVDDAPDRGANDRSCVYYTYTERDGSWRAPVAIEDDGTLDRDPVIYDMGDKLFVAWLTANDTFDGQEDSLATVSKQLNALNIHGAFFDKTSKTFGEVFEITKNTEDDVAAEGNVAMTRIGTDGLRVYYTKTQYQENPDKVNDLIAESAVIAYREYKDGAWSEEYTAAEQANIKEAGLDAKDYTAQWYGQRFEDTRLSNQWPLVTDLEVDIAPEGEWNYFAFIADKDGSYETTSDRKIYFNFAAYDGPVCITPKEGAYDDLQFVYSDDELLMAFKSTEDIVGENGETIPAGGISYINLSEVFEKQTYQAVKQADGTYQMALAASANGGNPVYYTPESAVTMEGVVQKYDIFADRGGRIYLMWTDTTLGDDDTSSIQVYASVYNGKAEWSQGIDSNAGHYGRTWSHPVMLTSPIDGSYESFTAQSITGDGIAFVAKRTNTDDETEMVFHLRAPQPVFTFNEDLLSTDYAYEGIPVTVCAEITNVGLKAQKSQTETDSGQNTWVALPGNYQIKIERLVNGHAEETLAAYEIDTIWNVGDTLFAECEWTPETLEDNMDIQVSVTDTDTGDVICSQLMPVVKAAEVELGGVDVVSEEKNRAEVSFDVLNKGNIPADLTAVIYLLTEEGKKVEVSREDIGTVAATETISQVIDVPIEEKYQTIDREGGNGSFKLQIDIVSGDERMYSADASGAMMYNANAIADVTQIEGISATQAHMNLQKGDTAPLQLSLTPASAEADNKLIYVSDDPKVASVDINGKVTAVGKGSTTITAYAVSKMEFSAIQPDGATKLLDVRNFIPDSMLKSQEITVNVGSGGTTAAAYTVKFDTLGGSKVDSVRVEKNGKLKAPTAPSRDGYTFAGWYTDKACTKAYDFDTKVAASFTLYAKWIKGEDDPSDWKNPFTDVKKTDWFYGDVQYVHENNLFAGVSANEFGPRLPMTRAMLVTVLHRASGAPSPEKDQNTHPFTDVAQDSWYNEAVAWGHQNGIIAGVSDNRFAPNTPITREQIAAIMKRYAAFTGASTDETGDLSKFKDAAKISDWATEAVKWAVGAGVIGGNDNGEVNPLGQASRAEVAAILHRFMLKN